MSRALSTEKKTRGSRKQIGGGDKCSLMLSFHSSVNLQIKTRLLDVLAMAIEQATDISCGVLYKALLGWTRVNQACDSCSWFSLWQSSSHAPSEQRGRSTDGHWQRLGLGLTVQNGMQ